MGLYSTDPLPTKAAAELDPFRSFHFLDCLNKVGPHKDAMFWRAIKIHLTCPRVY